MEPQLRKCVHQTGLLALLIHDWCGTVQSIVAVTTPGHTVLDAVRSKLSRQGNKPVGSFLPRFLPWVPSVVDYDWMFSQTPFCTKLALASALLQQQVRHILCLFVSSGKRKRCQFNIISAVHWNKWFQTKILLMHIKIIIPHGIIWNQVWFLRKPLFT